ncbi:MAG: serine/threonine-protein kinase [Planctomycetaceae bacterium]
MSTNHCDQQLLDRVLSDQSEHPDSADVIAHLSHCTACQERLDLLAADSSWWECTREYLSEETEATLAGPSPPHTLILPVLAESTPPPPLAIDEYLDPPSHPEMLGRVGKYDVEREIGRGGMSIVLRGFDSELNRPVAIKLLAPHLASSGIARQRFIREARAAAAVVHDHVITIHGIETESKLPAIVMPLIAGPSLHGHVERHGTVDPIDIARIGIQIAAGLSAAHAQGLVHRDIKPANILLENGLSRVQITDFGLARAAHDANLTQTSVITGTPHFMSPEQAEGDTIDHRSDLFSLGSVLYFMATGQLPFTGTTTMGVLRKVYKATPTRIRELNPLIPQRLESVIDKLMEKSPDDRFETASELRQYLSDYLAHLQQPTARKPPRRLLTSAIRDRRRKWVLGSLAIVIGLLAVLFASRTGTQPKSAVERPTARPVIPDIDASLPTFAELGVVSSQSIDQELAQVTTEVNALEQRPPLPETPSNFPQEVSQLAAALSALEESRIAETDSTFDSEVQSINAALQQLE